MSLVVLCEVVYVVDWIFVLFLKTLSLLDEVRRVIASSVVLGVAAFTASSLAKTISWAISIVGISSVGLAFEPDNRVLKEEKAARTRLGRGTEAVALTTAIVAMVASKEGLANIIGKRGFLLVGRRVDGKVFCFFLFRGTLPSL